MPNKFSFLGLIEERLVVRPPLNKITNCLEKFLAMVYRYNFCMRFGFFKLFFLRYLEPFFRTFSEKKL